MSAIVWRWDQGRLTYFSYDNLRKLALTLANLQGCPVGTGGLDPTGAELRRATGLTFPPNSPTYAVWRNFARIFARALLATSMNRQVVATDLCKAIASDTAGFWDVDQYFAFLIPRFYDPSPAYQGFVHTGDRVFALCAILRFLLSQLIQGRPAVLSLSQAFSLLIGNVCRGDEPLSHYAKLQESGLQPVGDQGRQVRELLIFASQASYLKWIDGKLLLDAPVGDPTFVSKLEAVATPLRIQRKADAAAEVISLGQVDKFTPADVAGPWDLGPLDAAFVEGKRVRATHIRVERSSKLRRLLLRTLTPPLLCDMCTCNTGYRYPWVDNLLQAHHLLPLTSSLAVNTGGTSVKDLVAVCPTCHNGIHAYYRGWLTRSALDDFPSKEAARGVYEEAKHLVRLR